jgi:hypothetical protein
MILTDTQIDLFRTKERRRCTCASADLSVIAARIALMAEQLPPGQAIAREMESR